MPNAAAAARKVTGRTGSTCPESGPYRSAGKARVVLFIKQGDTFPPDADGAPTTWALVTADEGR
jgi:hypothetical protein